MSWVFTAPKAAPAHECDLPELDADNDYTDRPGSLWECYCGARYIVGGDGQLSALPRPAHPMARTK